MKGVAPIKAEYLVANTKTETDSANTKTETGLGVTPSAIKLETPTDVVSVEAAGTEKRPLEDSDSVAQADVNPKKRKRGQNKQREKFSNKRSAPEFRLCKAIVCDTVCAYGDSCTFSHDVAGFMAKKSADLPGTCYNFTQLGRCPFGFTCRFALSHVTEVDGKFSNVVNEEVSPKSKSVNSISKDNLILLRKHKYSFSKADAATKEAVKFVDKIVKRNVQLNSTKRNQTHNSCSDTVTVSATGDNAVTAASDKGNEAAIQSQNGAEPIALATATDVSATAAVQDENEAASDELPSTATLPAEAVLSNPAPAATDLQPAAVVTDLQPAPAVTGLQPTGPITNEDQFTIKPGEKKTIDFQNKLYLAPLTTVGNLPFRRVCKTYGADITCGEMALATKILQGVGVEWALLKRHSSEDLFGVQLCGAFANTMTKCTQLLNETCDIDFIDINVGCPIELIFNQGAGSALMRKPNRFHEIVRSMVQVSDIPITVKIRTGIAETKNTAHTLIPKLKSWGLSLTTLHGRSREQRYTKSADWEYIDECAKLAAPMPFFGGGDILSFEDYNDAMKSNICGTMIARGALIKPWLFTEIKEQRHWDISSSERLDLLRDFSNYGLEHWGSDLQGVETTRRFMLEWLSFLHRYIPVGLLERCPQKINERPYPYFGRDDLETIMASPNSADWVKISEMLLGPVPDGFFFIPKHRANSFS